MNVLLVSGLGYNGKINQDLCYGWQYLFQDPEFNTFHISLACPLETFNNKMLLESKAFKDHYELIFLVMSKDYPLWMNALHQLRKIFPDTIIAVMQEGAPEDMYHPSRVQYAMNHLATIRDKDCKEYDILFCHNQLSHNFYVGITSHPVYVLPTAYPIDYVKQFRLPLDQRHEILINGSISNEYNGLVNLYAVGMHYYKATMCRRYSPWNIFFQLNGDEIPEMHWTKWIQTINQFRIMIAVNNSIGSGSVPLAMACLGIPCIGNQWDYPMQVLFKKLCCHPYDLVRIKDMVFLLMNSENEMQLNIGLADKNLEAFSRKRVKEILMEEIMEIRK